MKDNYKNYAEALFELAVEEDKLERIYEEFSLAKDVLKNNKEYFKIFSSPVVSETEKLKLIEAAFEGADSTFLRFLKLLAKNGMLNLAVPCAESFEELYFKKHGIIKAEAKTAVKLSSDEEKRLCESLEKKTGRKVRLKNIVDPTLLGGVVLSFSGTMLDGSIKTRLSNLEKSFFAASQ